MLTRASGRHTIFYRETFAILNFIHNPVTFFFNLKMCVFVKRSVILRISLFSKVIRQNVRETVY